MALPADELINLTSPVALQGFLDAAPDSIVVVDRAGRIVLVNELAEKMFGYPRQELIGQSIELLVPDRYRGLHARHRDGYAREPRTRRMGEGRKLDGRRKDGSEFSVEISLSPLNTDRGPMVISIIRDTTPQERAAAALRASLKEKEVLLKEIHHRVKNNLQIVSSLLNLQMDQIRDPLALALFRESQSRVRSIALFHEKLYQAKDLAHVDLAEYLAGIGNGLFAAWGVNPDRVALTFDVEAVPLSVDAAISCGLMVNELVSNAFKHAFPAGRTGRVWVRLRAEGREAVLEVGDDGVGFPPDLELRSAPTLGLKLVSILAEQLKGETALERSPGTRFTIRFPAGAHE